VRQFIGSQFKNASRDIIQRDRPSLRLAAATKLQEAPGDTVGALGFLENALHVLFALKRVHPAAQKLRIAQNAGERITKLVSDASH
jgi:hypothetical protein